MSIQSEIERITNNVQSTINTIADTGVAVASGANSDDLPALAAALANEKADKNHTHNYLPTGGGNVSGHIYLTGAKESSSTGNTSQLVFGTSSANHLAVSSNKNALVLNPTTTTTANQIVLYLDKASVFPNGISGNASSATKLGTSGGSATQPVYFSGGKPAACTYTLEKSVPSDAKFTDTTYSAATTSAAGLMSAADKTKLNGIATGANAYTLPTASSSTLGGVKTTSTVTSSSGYTACPIISGVPYYKDTNTTYDNIPKTTTVTASASVSANTNTSITIDYSSISGTILLTFFCGFAASDSSSYVTTAVPTYGTIGKVDRVRVISTKAQTINVCIGVIYK